MSAAPADRVADQFRAIGRAIRTAPPRAILLTGFAMFVLWSFPGYMSVDSANQLHEARTLEFSDAHPPIMAAEWAVLDRIVSGPILMLLLQGTVFLAGLYALLCRLLSPRRAAVAAALLMLYPAVISTMSVIWKDSQMAACLIAGTPLLLSARRGVRLGGLGLMSAACAFRYNGAAAMLPLVFLLFEWRPGLPRIKRYAIALAAAVACTVTAFGVNRALTIRHNLPVIGYHDIVGVLAFTGDRSDDDLRHVLRGVPLRVTTGIQAAARRAYDPRNAYALTHGDERMFDDPRTDAERAAVGRALRELVLDDPAAYLSHRWAVTRELLGLSSAGLWGALQLAFIENWDQIDWIHHDASTSKLQDRLWHEGRMLEWHTPMFRPWLYLVIALALLVLCCRDRLTFALLASGLLYEASFVPTAATPDYRYSHWMITATCVSAVILFVLRWRRGRAEAVA